MNIRKSFYAFEAILSGLIIAQVLSTADVCLSNTELLRTLEAITQEGYLAVPNVHVMPALRTFKAAFLGGIFFTLSVGAGLSVSAFASAWIWDRLLSRDPYHLIPFLTIWLAGIWFVNSGGVCGMATAYMLVIPPIVFKIASQGMPKPPDHLPLKAMTHIITVSVLILMGYDQINGGMFLKIRDNLLLSNAVGMKLNRFYYDYTLYAAQVFKPQKQKLIKTCKLTFTDDDASLRTMEKRLLGYDYLIIHKDFSADLDIVKTRKHLIFKNKGNVVLRTTYQEFIRNSRKILNEFSRKTDRRTFFRKFTFFSLMTVPPLILYLGIYGLFRMITGIFLDDVRASAGAGMLCCVTALLFFFLAFGGGQAVDTGDPGKLIASHNWRHRVAALKMILRKKIDISTFPEYVHMLDSPHVPERYWLAKALGDSRSPKTYAELLKLLNDPHFNVVYSALSGLGRRGRKEVIKDILRQIRTSDNWYVQGYAYKAIRRLGWKQKKLGT